MTIQIEAEKLQQEHFAKYLGAYFDNNLSRKIKKEHIEKWQISTNERLGILRKTHDFLQEKQLKNL